MMTKGDKRAKRIVEFINELESEYGFKRRVKLYDFISGLVFKLFCSKWGVRESMEYVDIISECYVDWNEFRYTSIDHIQDKLGFSVLDLRFIVKLKSIISSIYERVSTFDTEAFRNMEALEALSLLDECGVDKEIAATALLTYADQPILPLPDRIFRLIKNTGLFPKKASRKRVRKFILGMEEKDIIDVYQTFRLLEEHAETVCGPKDPECNECFFSKDCPNAEF